MLTLRQLRYLEALGRTLHFGKAARECAVTQPALSQQIQGLEAHLGLVLVERGRNAVRLTPEGEAVAAHARSILSEIRELESLSSAKKGLAGRVRIGMIPTIAPYLLPELLPRFTEHFPQALLDIRETQTAQLLDEIGDGRLDLIVAALPLEAPALEVHPLFEDRFLLATSSENPPPANGDLASFIAGQNLLLLEEGHCLREQVLRHCELAGIHHGHVYGTSNLSTLLQMVAGGLGVTLVPRLSLWQKTPLAGLRLSAFGEPEPYRRVALAWRRASPLGRHFHEIGKMILALQSEHEKIGEAA